MFFAGPLGFGELCLHFHSLPESLKFLLDFFHYPLFVESKCLLSSISIVSEVYLIISSLYALIKKDVSYSILKICSRHILYTLLWPMMKNVPYVDEKNKYLQPSCGMFYRYLLNLFGPAYNLALLFSGWSKVC